MFLKALIYSFNKLFWEMDMIILTVTIQIFCQCYVARYKYYGKSNVTKKMFTH